MGALEWDHGCVSMIEREDCIERWDEMMDGEIIGSVIFGVRYCGLTCTCSDKHRVMTEPGHRSLLLK